MPLQNRVTPFGEIVADPGRGLLTGNRGCLHGQGRELGVSRWRSKMWISCLVEFRGWKRDPMPPGRWTALFFLDEATAMSAGHRPCAFCRYRDYRAFNAAWREVQHLDRRLLAPEMDTVLHRERTDRSRRKLTYRAAVASLPDGVMIRHGEGAGLLLGGRVLPWSFAGYGAPAAAPASHADVLTPRSMVAAIGAGYQPGLHPSAHQAD